MLIVLVTSAVDLIKTHVFFLLIIEIIYFSRLVDLVLFKIVDTQNGKHCGVSPDHGRDIHLLADHTTKLRHFTDGDIREFSVFTFSIQLTFEQTLRNLIVCLTISHKAAQTSWHVAVDTR